MKLILFAPKLISLPIMLLVLAFPATYLLLRSAYEDYTAVRIVKQMKLVHASV
jgi:hypothetical protein